MRVMTVLGTRPEVIRLSGVVRMLDCHAEQILVHTDQNFDERLSRIFFDELGVREPDVHMGVRAPTFGGQIGQILEGAEKLFREQRPDRLLILGDTDSGLAALVARRLGIPVYHMEAGNRCYDDRVPEEVNRRVIDHCSSVLMPYTRRSKENLLREGIPGERIFVTGNPIKEVMDAQKASIDASRIVEELGLQECRYFLVTMHRAENVDVESRLRDLVEALARLHQQSGYPVVCSLHPRTRSRVENFGVDIARAGLLFMKPFGFRDFLRLERSAACLISDSGTVQEEACILGVPNVTIREVTERPETVECGSNLLSGTEPESVCRAVRLVMTSRGRWVPPEEYCVLNVAETVCRIVLGFRIPDAAELSWRQRNRN